MPEVRDLNGRIIQVATKRYVDDQASVTDHGALTGLTDDDHSQYHNDARGDARYLKDLVDDTTPQLGGDLDCQDKAISDIKSLAFNDGDKTITEVKDEDNMASDSNTKLATQQSIKAYVDDSVPDKVTASQNIVTGSRALATTYQNNTGTALIITVSTWVISATPFLEAWVAAAEGNADGDHDAYRVAFSLGHTQAGGCITFVVPPAYYYRAELSVEGQIITWTEWALGVT